MAPWRDLPITRLLLSDIAERKQAGLWQLLEDVNENEIDRARVNAGALNTLISLESAMFPPERLPDTEDSTFVDPAALPPKTKGTL